MPGMRALGERVQPHQYNCCTTAAFSQDVLRRKLVAGLRLYVVCKRCCSDHQPWQRFTVRSPRYGTPAGTRL